MNTITLTIAATPDNLRKLAAAFGDVIDETMPGDAIPAKRYATGACPGEPDVRSAEIQLPETVAKEPETVAEDPETAEKEPETVAKRTLSEVRAKAAAVVKAGHKDALKALLAEFDAPKVPELPEDKWGAFYERLEAIA